MSRRTYTFRKEDDGTDVATLTRRGGNMSDALAKGSDFLKVVEGLDRKREYVFLVVDPASFETFRTIRAELRRRDIDSGWNPSYAVNFNFVAQGGADPGTVD